MCISGVNVVCLMIGMKCKEIKGKIKTKQKTFTETAFKTIGNKRVALSFLLSIHPGYVVMVNKLKTVTILWWDPHKY